MAQTDERFDRQVRFEGLGVDGQAKLEQASVLLVGCGALGGVLAQSLTRSGVGRLVLVDRDIVELSNLPRQVLFEERHATEGVPKVLAAQESLARIGGPTEVEVHATHLDAANLAQLALGADLVLDGTDNLTTRYLLNDYCVREELPWIYGGVVGAHGLLLAVRPGLGPCLRCVFPDPPPAGVLPTCDTAGVVLPAVAAIASFQAGLALRLLADGPSSELVPALLQLDVWRGEAVRLEAERVQDCPACGQRRFPFLEEAPERPPVVLCGRNTVQVTGGGVRPDLEELSARLAPLAGNLQRVGPILRFAIEDMRFTVFPDGRALIEGTDDPDRARAVYDRFVGS